MTKSPNTPIRVAILDDHTLLRELLKGSLNAETDIEVVGEATNGAEAVALSERLSPDVVILDIAMPVMDGWECLSRLRGDPKTRGVPVVIMTAWLSDDLKSRARTAGAARFLIKPFDQDELVDIVRALARERCG